MFFWGFPGDGGRQLFFGLWRFGGDRCLCDFSRGMGWKCLGKINKKGGFSIATFTYYTYIWYIYII